LKKSSVPFQGHSQPITKDEATAQALKNLKLVVLNDSLDEARYDFMYELAKDIPAKAKLNRLKKVADKINAVATPHSACKTGCSHCCHISAIITQSEADSLAAASGRKAKRLADVSPTIEARDKWFKVPCPFLVKGRCSVYEDRPIVCRLLFNLADNPYFCDTAIPPQDSHVTMLNLHELEQGYVKAFIGQTWGDIRDFFPQKTP
jgi:Fe-S-cluster containining protein